MPHIYAKIMQELRGVVVYYEILRGYVFCFLNSLPKNKEN